jgi:hypothetical protein
MHLLDGVILLVLSGFLISILSVPVSASPEHHSPTLIVPTKFRLLMMDMIEEEKHAVTPVVTPTPSITILTEKAQDSSIIPHSDDNEIISMGLKRDASQNYMGRGFVQTNFDVNFDEQGRNIDNHEVLSARGLFDVHVTHGLN